MRQEPRVKKVKKNLLLSVRLQAEAYSHLKVSGPLWLASVAKNSGGIERCRAGESLWILELNRQAIHVSCGFANAVQFSVITSNTAFEPESLTRQRAPALYLEES
jgi:hypothetical protein